VQDAAIAVWAWGRCAARGRSYGLSILYKGLAEKVKIIDVYRFQPIKLSISARAINKICGF
jgi:hypothetical protein